MNKSISESAVIYRFGPIEEPKQVRLVWPKVIRLACESPGGCGKSILKIESVDAHMTKKIFADYGVLLDGDGFIAGFGRVAKRPEAGKERAAFRESGGQVLVRPEGRHPSWGWRLKSVCMRCLQGLAAMRGR